MHYCRNCLQQVDDNVVYCPNCGAQQDARSPQSPQTLSPQQHPVSSQPPPPPPMEQLGVGGKNRSPAISAVFNLFIPGLGYLYDGLGRDVGEAVFGVLVFASVFLGLYLPLFVFPPATGSTSQNLTLADYLSFLFLILPIALAYDAYRRTEKKNRKPVSPLP
ncbi:MAG: zinc ribbon domain-containing protein [Thaumarchaeota archaeon]|nr:zinc ribbon domain-containing protein [Nitrososphaerota archaeon]